MTRHSCLMEYRGVYGFLSFLSLDVSGTTLLMLEHRQRAFTHVMQTPAG